MPQLNAKDARQVIIFCGENPRPLLADTLAKRGFRVNVIPVYRRAIPSVDAPVWIEQWHNDMPNCVMFTSVETAQNFKTLLGTAFNGSFRDLSIIVAGHRIETACRRLDYRGGCTVAQSASDDDMVGAVVEATIDNER